MGETRHILNSSRPSPPVVPIDFFSYDGFEFLVTAL